MPVFPVLHVGQRRDFYLSAINPFLIVVACSGGVQRGCQYRAAWVNIEENTEFPFGPHQRFRVLYSGVAQASSEH